MAALSQNWSPKSWRRIVLAGVSLGALFWLANTLIHFLFHLLLNTEHTAADSRIDLLAALIVFVLFGIYSQVMVHQQRGVEQRLRQLSRAVEQSPSTVMITNLAGQIEYVNPKFTALTGYTLAEVRGKNPNILKSGETEADEYARMWAAIKAGDEWRGEFHNVKKSGDLYWEYALISPIKDGQGRITHYLAVKEDITARKEAEEAERAQRVVIEALRDMANAINQLIDISDVLDFILANLHRIVHADAAHIVIFGESDSHVVRSQGYDRPRLDRLLALRKQPVAVQEVAQLFSDQTPVNLSGGDYAQTYWGKLLEQPWGQSHLLAPVRLRGRLIGLLALDACAESAFSAQDAWRLQAVAEQTATAVQNAHTYDAMRDYAIEREEQLIERTAELERERAKLRAIFESMGEGVAYMENDRLQFVNQTLVTMLGYDPQDAIGTDLTLFNITVEKEPGENRLLRERIDYAFANNRPWRGELQLQRKDGSVLEASVTTTQVADLYNNLLGRVTIVRDVGREKALRAQKNRFLTHAAHELRTPMSNLKTRLYLLRHQPDKIPQHLSVLDDVSDGMARLIEDLLDVVRLEHNALLLRREVIPLRDIVREAVGAQQQQASNSSVSIVAELPDAPVPICADRRRIAQAITNLISVAIQDSLPGGAVNIRLSANGDEQRRVVLTIHDAGTGLSESDLGQAFEPFFRVTEGHTEGVSLGLTIARDIIELHNGTIELESSTGQGSLFRITLNGADDCTEQDEMTGLNYAVTR